MNPISSRIKRPDGYLLKWRQLKTEPVGHAPVRLQTCLLSNTIITDLEKIASQTAYDKGFEIIDLQVNSQPNSVSIQIQIRHCDKNKDVSINDCAQLNPPINEAIEDSKLIDQPFFLEISSTGISEFLTEDRDFQTFKGFPVEVTYKEDELTQKLQNGLLQDRSENDLLINLKGRISRIPRDDVIKVRLTTPTG